jgi:hypothetical protein
VQWFTPVIPSTWEAEIRKMRFEVSPGKILLPQPPSSTNKVDIVVHNCNSSYTGGIGRKVMVEGWPELKAPSLCEK